MNSKVLLVALVMVGTGMAQVASHAPAVAKTTKTSAAPAPAKAPSVQSPSASNLPMAPARPIVKINGTVLTDHDLIREMFAIFPYAAQHNGSFPKDMEPEIRRGAMEMIVFEELVYQDAKKRGVTVTAAEVAKAEAQFKKQFHSESEFKDYLKVETNGSATVLRDKIRRSLVIDKAMKSEVKLKAQVTPAMVRAYYDNNHKQFQRAEMYHIQSISILPPQNDNNPTVIAEAKKRAEEAYKQAKNAKSYQEFGLLAEKYSDDDFHVNMGDHKPVEKDKLPPPVIKAAAAMKPGEVSSLIQLGNAYTIFRLNAHTPAGVVPFAEVQKKLQADMQKEKTQKVRAALGEKLRKGAKIETL